MKLSATSLLVTFATLSGVLAQTCMCPEVPSMGQPMKLARKIELWATECTYNLAYGEKDYHLRCNFHRNHQKPTEEEAKASGAKWKVLATEL
ncbi:uncharacterized protein G6M90_00g111280 [Metarhizium brunneum]|uniref:Uncharacterized protein n=1 Tax=Metarhizium brunneum TaxID=500148 RepID=A0A7D5V4M2_9HYPO|nr:hypothetical protein G6M90_00g111280 [Metarhizium brunneum]